MTGDKAVTVEHARGKLGTLARGDRAPILPRQACWRRPWMMWPPWP